MILIGTACANSTIARSSSTNASINPYCSGEGNLEELRCNLALAQLAQDLPQVEQLATNYARALGSQAGIPEVEPKFVPVEPDGPKLTPAQLKTAFIPYIQRIEREAWWLSYPAPTAIEVPLRRVAGVITGCLAAKRAGAENPERLLQLAEGAANYLLWAQAQGGRDLFPFPNLQGNLGRPAAAAEQFLKKAEETGQLSDVLVNGWIVDDGGGGDLQFDNGLAGVALIELYEATGNQRYLDSALTAANWAMDEPIVPNWNYNSFSVYLLSHAYRVTNDSRYLDSAKEKARLGIYPGQLRSGTYRGRWSDGHNARINYHYVIIRGLGALVAVLPNQDPDFPQARDTLSLALRVRNAEIIQQNSVVYPQEVLDALCRLQISLPVSDGRLEDEGRTQALDIVGRYVTSQFLNQQWPVQPDAWGLFLETQSRNIRV